MRGNHRGDYTCYIGRIYSPKISKILRSISSAEEERYRDIIRRLYSEFFKKGKKSNYFSQNKSNISDTSAAADSLRIILGELTELSELVKSKAASYVTECPYCSNPITFVRNSKDKFYIPREAAN